MAQIRQLCKAGAVLENGQLTYYDDVEEAIAQHHATWGPTRTSTRANLSGLRTMFRARNTSLCAC